MLNTSIAGAFALDAARTLAHVDQLARDLWQAHGAGKVTDADATAMAEALEVRKREIMPKDRTAVRAPAPAPRSRHRTGARRPRSPDRQRSIERRRERAEDRYLPRPIRYAFTEGERAALNVIGRQIYRFGTCSLPVDAIAALAGVGRSTVQNATSQAQKRGLIDKQERRRKGAPSLTNIITIIAPEWLAHLALCAGNTGPKTPGATDSGFYSSLEIGKSAAKTPPIPTMDLLDSTRLPDFDGRPSG